MAELWERSFEEICGDEGEAYLDSMSWRDAYKLVKQKWKPFVSIAAQKMSELKDHENAKLDSKEIPYFADTSICAFCLKAASIAHREDFGLKGATCLACCLQGKCFDDSWKIKDVFIALRNEKWDDFKELINEGLQEILAIAREYDKERKEIK